MPTVVIAGASGLVGDASIRHYTEQGWDVVALSRRPPEVPEGANVRHLAVDLTDREAAQQALGSLSQVDQLIFAAIYEKPGLSAGTERDMLEVNDILFRNTLDPLAPLGLEHVTLLQGTKAYGIHLGINIRIPAKERQPRVEHENFYWLQEAHLIELANQYGFTYTILRPQFVFGGSVGAAMNTVPVLGLYAAYSRQDDRPLSFPGGPPRVLEGVDARLIAEASLWAHSSPNAAGETFNITNGDVFDWRDLWPSLAAQLGMEAGPDEPRSLAEYLAGTDDRWNLLVDKYDLRPITLSQFLGQSHHYADVAFGYGWPEVVAPSFVSIVKLRQAGFCAAYDTEDTFAYWFDVLRHRRLLPADLSA